MIIVSETVYLVLDLINSQIVLWNRYSFTPSKGLGNRRPVLPGTQAAGCLDPLTSHVIGLAVMQHGNSLKSKTIILFYSPRAFLLEGMFRILFHLTTLREDIPSEKIGATSSLTFGVYHSSPSEVGEDSFRGKEEGPRVVLSHGHTLHVFLTSVPSKTPL